MAKASGKEVRGLAREGATDSLWEANRRARPSQALIVRLVPSGVNGSRPRLNRLSKMALRVIRGLNA